MCKRRLERCGKREGNQDFDEKLHSIYFRFCKKITAESEFFGIGIGSQRNVVCPNHIVAIQQTHLPVRLVDFHQIYRSNCIRRKKDENQKE